ncbi:hypothetical protein [Anaeromassilibacillus sp. SJQ-1]|uniref:hypothetical protein n=1 Tax=Anaeromassilibacillus sp. SJQ-1 TaxID=3375419 RepID=UPI00398A37F6
MITQSSLHNALLEHCPAALCRYSCFKPMDAQRVFRTYSVSCAGSLINCYLIG